MIMSEDTLSILLGTTIIPAILSEFVAPNVDINQTADCFFRSELYRQLSDPHTGLWHLSPLTLASMYQEELETGIFEVPEEQS
jgi:hypothetical protein